MFFFFLLFIGYLITGKLLFISNRSREHNNTVGLGMISAAKQYFSCHHHLLHIFKSNEQEPTSCAHKNDTNDVDQLFTG